MWQQYIKILYRKSKFGQISPKIKAIKFSHYLHTSQFEDIEHKYDIIKRILNSNPKLRKCSSSIQTL